MNKPCMHDSYTSFKKDVAQLLHIKDNSTLDEICLFSWNVSFMEKKQRIEKILTFLEMDIPDKVYTELQKYNILELILSLSHFRRAKYKNNSLHSS